MKAAYKVKYLPATEHRGTRFKVTACWNQEKGKTYSKTYEYETREDVQRMVADFAGVAPASVEIYDFDKLHYVAIVELDV